MKGYTIRFRAERRSGAEGNSPLLGDLSYFGRIKFNSGISLLKPDDFIVEAQSFRRNAKVKFGGQIVSASLASAHLELLKEKVHKAYQTLLISGNGFTVKDIYAEAFKKGKIAEKKKAASDHIIEIARRWYSSGVIANTSLYRYEMLAGIIERFNKLTPCRFELQDTTLDTLLKLRDFITNEYMYMDKHQELYKGMRFEKKPRSHNTVVSIIKKLNAIYKELKLPNPLNDTRRKSAILAEQYGEVFSLTKDELYQIIDAAVPEELQYVKDCFVVHCSLGARVADYHKMSQGKTMKHRAGFEYIVYAPAKTNARSKNVEVIEAPLLDFASEVLERYGYLPFRDWLFGDITTTYNEQIRQLLEFIGIDRPVSIRTNEGIKQVPLWQEASSKLARKTFISISDNAPVGAYLAGLHKEGSDAVKHYISKSVEDRYNFLKFAFAR